ncbi:hypothetical protein SAMN05660199_02347 [Klenkia soli]|uniref:Uncharacterized protein n=2 Tax=Klenkia soli TaxID=1052260 RepID=A0A1H0L720_9ACTN|nr:hypothetical protein SAMN05660199_02347 [Klenkia soli]
MRWTARVLAALLFVWMVVLVAVAPGAREFRADEEVVPVSCAGVAEAGWPFGTSPEWARDESGGPLTDSYAGGGVVELPSRDTQQYIADRCQDLRAARTGLAALLAVPTALLVALSVTGSRSARPR